MSKRLPCPPAPGPLEGYAARFDDLFGTLAAAIDRHFQGASWQRCQVHYARNLVGMVATTGARSSQKAYAGCSRLPAGKWPLGSLMSWRTAGVKAIPRSQSTSKST